MSCGLFEMLAMDGYRRVDRDEVYAGWYKIENGRFNYIPITDNILDDVVGNLEGIYTYNIVISKADNDLWQINWDEDCDGQCIYTWTKGRIPLTVELLYGHWQNDYKTFGTPENVWKYIKYFKQAFKNYEVD